MVLSAIFGVIILIVVIYIALRILGNVFLGVVMIGLVFLASYLILGSFPSLKSVPFIGKYLPELPTSTREIIAVVRNVLHSIKVLDVTRNSKRNLLIVVANTGKLTVSDFSVLVDGESVKVINSPEDPLESGKVTVFEVDWTKSFTQVDVKTDQVSASYRAD